MQQLHLANYGRRGLEKIKDLLDAKFHPSEGGGFLDGLLKKDEKKPGGFLMKELL